MDERAPATIQPVEPSGAGPRTECLVCGYATDAPTCPECGGRRDGRDQIPARYRVVTRVFHLLVAGILIQGSLFLLDALAPSIRQVWMVPGDLMSWTWILFDIALTILPTILVAIAAAQLSVAPWFLAPMERRLLKSACLLGLTFPAYWLGLQVMALSRPAFAADLAGWASPFIAATTLTGVVLLFRGLGLCSGRDRGGETRLFLRHAWVGAAILAAFNLLGAVALRLILWRANFGIPIPAAAEPLLTIAGSIGQSVLLLLVVFTPALWPWRRILAEDVVAVQSDAAPEDPAPPSAGR